MVEIIGSQVFLTDSLQEDAEHFAEFEQMDSEYVCAYSSPRHRDLIIDKESMHLSIRRVVDKVLVGHVILIHSDQSHSLEFRRLVVTDKGKGYGREALRLVKKLCFEELLVHRLWLDVFTANTRAIRLYESEGFVREGELRDAIMTKDGYKSLYLYSLLQSEYHS